MNTMIPLLLHIVTVKRQKTSQTNQEGANIPIYPQPPYKKIKSPPAMRLIILSVLIRINN